MPQLRTGAIAEQCQIYVAYFRSGRNQLRGSQALPEGVKIVTRDMHWRWLTKLLITITVAAVFAPAALAASGSCVARQVISPRQPASDGQPAPNIPVRVCTSAATGTPCSPLAIGGLFTDPALTHPLPNPLSTDDNGMYFFCAAQATYLVQETPLAGTVYSYLVTTPSIATGDAISLQGVSINPAAPVTNDVLQFNGTWWTPTPLSGNSTQIQGTPIDPTTPVPPSVFIANDVVGVPTAQWANLTTGQILAAVQVGELAAPPDTPPYSVSGWSAECDNEQSLSGGYYACSHLLVNTGSQVWLTEFYLCDEYIVTGDPGGIPTGTPPCALPHWAVIDMGMVQAVGAVGYQTRLDGYAFGNILDYNIYLRSDSGCGTDGAGSWGTAVKSGTFSATAPGIQLTNITGEPTARCVKLEALSAYDPRVTPPVVALGGSAIRVWAANQAIPPVPEVKAQAYTPPERGMSKNCGIIGSGDETYPLNQCIADLPNYATLVCDKPMTINSTGVVVNSKIGIVIKTGAGHHALDQSNAYCKINYTGAAADTVIDVNRVRDSLLFKGFAIIANAADKGIWTHQSAGGSGISSANTYEDVSVINNNNRLTFVGYPISAVSDDNCDEMTFRRAAYSTGGTQAGTAFAAYNVNVKGTRFEDIVIVGAKIGWSWGGYSDFVVAKGNGYNIGTLYVGQMPWLITQDDYEAVTMVADEWGAGEGGYRAYRGRYALCSPSAGSGGCPSGNITGTPGYPAWRAAHSLDTSNVKIDFHEGTMVACFGTCDNTIYKGFPDPGAHTFNNFQYNPTSLQGQDVGDISRESWSWTGAGGPNGIGNNWTGWNLIDPNGQGVRGIGMTVAGSGFTPCGSNNLCIGDGQAEFTGVHQQLGRTRPTYTGTAGTTDRTYRIMACSANPCSVGTRTIPGPGLRTFAITAATLSGSNYVTLSWVPSFGAVSYSIIQDVIGGTGKSELMTGVTCSTNPCTVNVTTDASTTNYVVPTYNETGGVKFRGLATALNGVNIPTGQTYQVNAVQISAANLSNGTTGSGAVVLAGSPTFTTQISTPKIAGITDTNVVANLHVANSDALGGATFAAPGAIGGGTPSTGAFTSITVTSTNPVANLTTVPTTYNQSGTQQTATHLVVDSCVLGTSCAVTLTGAAVFTSSTSYTCGCQDATTALNACGVAQASGSAFTITGTGTDTIRYQCSGN